MNRIPENKILKFNPDTLIALRKMYNLDKPGQMDEAIDLLDDWVKKQTHFRRKDFSREYLERVIILIKGSVERAKGQLDKICTLRTLLPHFFEKCDAKNDLKIIKGKMYWAVLPKLTKDNVRIIFLKYEPVKLSAKFHSHVYFYTILISEYLKAHDYSNGIATVFDIRGINMMEFVSQLNLIELKQICTIFLEGYDTRAQNFFFLSSSKTIDVLIKLFKQMISEKLGKRIHILKENDDLHEYIPKELLPSDYGGDQKTLAELNDELTEELSTKENVKYFREMSKAVIDESLRTSTNYSGDFLGISGTFRTLSVD